MKDFGLERVGWLIVTRVADTRERDAHPPGRNNDRLAGREPEVGGHPEIFDRGIATVWIPPFTTRRRSSTVKSAASVVRHRGPVVGREVRQAAFAHSACRVFQPPRRRLQFLEASERGVEVCLVEDFAAVDHVAFDRQ